jgi:hypothetical protein
MKFITIDISQGSLEKIPKHNQKVLDYK